MKSYFIDAFVADGFKGNPACVTLLDENLPAEELLAIAKRNALPETAFLLKKQGGYSLRWFTPDIEMDLCGHATLASAYAVLNLIGKSGESVTFDTVEGAIIVVREPSGELTLNFPERMPKEAQLPDAILNSLSIKPKEVWLSRDYLILYDSQEQIREFEISNLNLFNSINLDPGGVVATAPGAAQGVDFVSRFFTPQATILEDPVTGSAHCSLAPFWAKRLGRNNLVARQLSERGGELHCRVEDGRVFISGRAALVRVE